MNIRNRKRARYKPAGQSTRPRSRTDQPAPVVTDDTERPFSSADLVKLERPVGFSILAGLLTLTAVGVVLFWSLLPADSPPNAPTDQAALYLVWKRSFPLAEAWMVLTAITAAIGLLWMRDWGLLFGCLAGSALVFLGLTSVLFFLQHGLYSPLTTNWIIELIIHGWCLTFGPFVVAYLWGKRGWLFQS